MYVLLLKRSAVGKFAYWLILANKDRPTPGRGPGETLPFHSPQVVGPILLRGNSAVIRLHAERRTIEGRQNA